MVDDWLNEWQLPPNNHHYHFEVAWDFVMANDHHLQPQPISSFGPFVLPVYSQCEQ
jgi:hypothetical protein